jgi:putative nucleotidyltransferase with HDIG domain
MQRPKDLIQAEEVALDAFIDRISHLPPTPTLMIQLIDLFRQSDADVDQIVALLRRDPALSLEVIRRCNNARFAGDSPVRDINAAVFRLGFHEVYKMVVSMCGMRTLTAKEVPGFSAEALRRHSCIAAIAAGMLALSLGESEGIAFTAGLLHDVGKLILALGEGEKYVALMDHCHRTGTSLSMTEKVSFGFNHKEVGARLLRRWGAPDEVSLPALMPLEVDPEVELHRIVVITKLASLLAQYIEQEKPAVPFSGLTEVRPLTEAINLDDVHLLAWEGQVRSKVKELPATLTA